MAGLLGLSYQILLSLLSKVFPITGDRGITKNFAGQFGNYTSFVPQLLRDILTKNDFTFKNLTINLHHLNDVVEMFKFLIIRQICQFSHRL